MRAARATPDGPRYGRNTKPHRMPDNKQPALTREEQIKLAAQFQYRCAHKPYEDFLNEGFERGAKWADATPVPVSSSGEENPEITQADKEYAKVVSERIIDSTDPMQFAEMQQNGLLALRYGVLLGIKEGQKLNGIGSAIATRLRQPPTEGWTDELVLKAIKQAFYNGTSNVTRVYGDDWCGGPKQVFEQFKPSAPTTSPDDKNKLP